MNVIINSDLQIIINIVGIYFEIDCSCYNNKLNKVKWCFINFVVYTRDNLK